MLTAWYSAHRRAAIATNARIAAPEHTQENIWFVPSRPQQPRNASRSRPPRARPGQQSRRRKPRINAHHAANSDRHLPPNRPHLEECSSVRQANCRSLESVPATARYRLSGVHRGPLNAARPGPIGDTPGPSRVGRNRATTRKTAPARVAKQSILPNCTLHLRLAAQRSGSQTRTAGHGGQTDRSNHQPALSRNICDKRGAYV